MKKVFFLLIMFSFFIEASSCNNSQGEKHNEMKVSLKINKMVAGNPWIKENIKELEKLNYYKK